MVVFWCKYCLLFVFWFVLDWFVCVFGWFDFAWLVKLLLILWMRICCLVGCRWWWCCFGFARLFVLLMLVEVWCLIYGGWLLLYWCCGFRDWFGLGGNFVGFVVLLIVVYARIFVFVYFVWLYLLFSGELWSVLDFWFWFWVIVIVYLVLCLCCYKADI